MYIIQEIQTTNGSSALLPAITKQDRHEAESSWHSIMASAAISNIQVHTVLMYDEHGNIELRGYYEHNSEE